ncbi:MAG: hypothetical protein IT381_17815 [Deltaproteobacteria bacterium]|nr:hypothetical protein [Deltaproteobacteria bacterium]
MGDTRLETNINGSIHNMGAALTQFDSSSTNTGGLVDITASLPGVSFHDAAGNAVSPVFVDPKTVTDVQALIASSGGGVSGFTVTTDPGGFMGWLASWAKPPQQNPVP